MTMQQLFVWPALDYVFFLGVLAVLGGILTIHKRYRSICRLVGLDSVLLELTPPPSPHNTIRATEEFFTVLRQVVGIRTWREMIAGRKSTISLEVVSNPTQGIRYLVRLPRRDESVFMHTLAALAPTVTAEETTDYMDIQDNPERHHLLVLRQTGPKMHSLRINQKEGATDPIAYLMNAMTELNDQEYLAFQIVLTPTPDWQLHLAKTHDATRVEEGIVSASLLKGRQPLFHAALRIVLRAETEQSEQRLKGVVSALSAYSYDGFQTLQPRLKAKAWLRRYQQFSVQHRLPHAFHQRACLLASSELAALYHFPYGTTSHTEDLRTAQAHMLPLPLDMKHRKDTDLSLGENYYRGRTTPIRITAADRTRHAYVVGGTGNGKTTLLQSMIVQDIKAGRGVAVIDPHGDLAETLLQHIPDSRIDDVVYFNPADLSHAIGLNMLELDQTLTGDALLQEKDLITESVVSMFRKIFSTNESSGHRIEYVLRNAVQTVLLTPEPTLFTIYELLNNKKYRDKIVKTIESPELRLFWNEYARAGSFQQVSMAAGITAKIGRFLFSASARRIIEQPRSTLSIDRLMDEEKILICNVSKGLLGEDTSELFGIMIMTKIQLATLRRARVAAEKRRPFYVYVDEFQNFATLSFVQLLSEARKYGLFLTLAEQSTSQQSDRRLIDIVFANVGTLVAFRTSSPADEQLLQPLLSPHVEPGTLRKLPAYSFYVRVASLTTTQPFSGRTVLVNEPVDTFGASIVIQASRLKYGRKTTPSTPQVSRRTGTKNVKRAPVIGELSDGLGQGNAQA